MSSKNSASDEKCSRGGSVSRREFARRAAMATAAVAALPGTLLADVRGLNPETASSEQAANVTTLSPASQTEAENKVQAIFKKHGSRLNNEQKTDIRRLVGVTQKQIDQLRAYALDNADQPATYLKPLMERPVRPAGAAAAPSATAARKPKK